MIFKWSFQPKPFHNSTAGWKGRWRCCPEFITILNSRTLCLAESHHKIIRRALLYLRGLQILCFSFRNLSNGFLNPCKWLMWEDSCLSNKSLSEGCPHVCFQLAFCNVLSAFQTWCLLALVAEEFANKLCLFIPQKHFSFCRRLPHPLSDVSSSKKLCCINSNSFLCKLSKFFCKKRETIKSQVYNAHVPGLFPTAVLDNPLGTGFTSPKSI